MTEIERFCKLLNGYILVQIASLDESVKKRISVEFISSSIDEERDLFNMKEMADIFQKSDSTEKSYVGLTEEMFRLKNDCLEMMMSDNNLGGMEKSKSLIDIILDSLQAIIPPPYNLIAHGISEIINIFNAVKNPQNVK